MIGPQSHERECRKKRRRDKGFALQVFVAKVDFVFVWCAKSAFRDGAVLFLLKLFV